MKSLNQDDGEKAQISASYQMQRKDDQEISFTWIY